MPLADRLAPRSPRLVAGVMSGTSTDGVDAAVARIDGSGREVRIEMLGFAHKPYDAVTREALLRNAEDATSSVRELALLDVLLARHFAAAIERLCAEIGIPTGELDLIGSHGHTFHHIPTPQAMAGEWVSATIQLGRGSVLATLTGVPVVSDFRSADMALGGQGAPLVPYFDWAVLGDAGQTRLLLNLGGIANLSVVPAGARRDEVFAFDTGPANMVLDALARRLLRTPFDEDGRAAARGQPDAALLEALLADPYFARPPPKSTGRERFGSDFVERLVATPLSPEDLLATATALTVRSIAEAVARFVRPHHEPEVMIVSGGGLRNPTLMRGLAEALHPIEIRSSSDYGVCPAAKESLCFALLAHEYLNGVPTNLPRVTGASREAMLGQLAVP